MVSDYYCIDTMKDIINTVAELSGVYEVYLSEDDKDILEKYSPKLFNGMDPKNIKNAMVGLVEVLSKYRTAIVRNMINESLYTHSLRTLKKKTDDSREQSLISAIEHLELMLDPLKDTRIVYLKEVGNNTAMNRLLLALEDAKNNPFEYIPKAKKAGNYENKNGNLSISKKPIEQYLFSTIKKQTKTNEIKDFIKAIS